MIYTLNFTANEAPTHCDITVLVNAVKSHKYITTSNLQILIIFNFEDKKVCY